MTVVGIGVDVVAVDSFSEQLAIAGTQMESQFTPAERTLRAAERQPAEHLAARWAAKEAFIKAWSAAGAGNQPVLGAIDHREIEVVRDPWGRPVLRLHGSVESAFRATIGDCQTHLSLSHDGGVAVAMVVIDR